MGMGALSADDFIAGTSLLGGWMGKRNEVTVVRKQALDWKDQYVIVFQQPNHTTNLMHI